MTDEELTAKLRELGFIRADDLEAGLMSLYEQYCRDYKRALDSTDPGVGSLANQLVLDGKRDMVVDIAALFGFRIRSA